MNVVKGIFSCVFVYFHYLRHPIRLLHYVLYQDLMRDDHVCFLCNSATFFSDVLRLEENTLSGSVLKNCRHSFSGFLLYFVHR